MPAEFSHPRQSSPEKMARMRTHISRTGEPIALREKTQPADERSLPAGKPIGLWYEVNGDWRRWCRENEWNLDALQYIHTVDLADANVLVIDTLAKLDAFHAEFCVGERFVEKIKWDVVARKYDGVEIAPYQWARRLDWSWYYGWDCASGVLWRPRNAAVSLVRKLPIKPKREAVSV
jgi:hypothetical protein